MIYALLVERPTEQVASRRERYRRDTMREIRDRVMRQLETQGAGAVSLNAVAREMGMSGPALYRYYPSRDAVLTDLIVETYEELGAVIERAVTGASDPGAAIRALANAYRSWAREHPTLYQLLLGTPVPRYEDDPARTTPPARRTLQVVIEALSSFADGPDEELRWAAVEGWSRLHGFVSLELGGHLEPLGLDLDSAYENVIQGLLNSG